MKRKLLRFNRHPTGSSHSMNFRPRSQETEHSLSMSGADGCNGGGFNVKLRTCGPLRSAATSAAQAQLCRAPCCTGLARFTISAQQWRVRLKIWMRSRPFVRWEKYTSCGTIAISHAHPGPPCPTQYLPTLSDERRSAYDGSKLVGLVPAGCGCRSSIRCGLASMKKMTYPHRAKDLRDSSWRERWTRGVRY